MPIIHTIDLPHREGFDCEADYTAICRDLIAKAARNVLELVHTSGPVQLGLDYKIDEISATAYLKIVIGYLNPRDCSTGEMIYYPHRPPNSRWLRVPLYVAPFVSVVKDRTHPPIQSRPTQFLEFERRIIPRLDPQKQWLDYWVRVA